MVFLEHRPRVYYSLTIAVEAMALLFVQQDVKSAIIVDHVTPHHGKKNGRSILDDCERAATVALPTAASPGLVPTTTTPLPQ